MLQRGAAELTISSNAELTAHMKHYLLRFIHGWFHFVWNQPLFFALLKRLCFYVLGTEKEAAMCHQRFVKPVRQKATGQAPTPEEIRELRTDAQHQVPEALEALQGNIPSLEAWRQKKLKKVA